MFMLGAASAVEHFLFTRYSHPVAPRGLVCLEAVISQVRQWLRPTVLIFLSVNFSVLKISERSRSCFVYSLF